MVVRPQATQRQTENRPLPPLARAGDVVRMATEVSLHRARLVHLQLRCVNLLSLLNKTCLVCAFVFSCTSTYQTFACAKTLRLGRRAPPIEAGLKTFLYWIMTSSKTCLRKSKGAQHTTKPHLSVCLCLSVCMRLPVRYAHHNAANSPAISTWHQF